MKRPLATAGISFLLSAAAVLRLETQYIAAIWLGVAVSALVCFLMRNFRNKSAVMCSLISSLAALLLMWAACSVRDVQIERISGKRQESRVVVTGVRRDCEIPRITARVYSVFGSKMLGITTSFSSKEELRAGEIADLTLEFDRIAPDDRSAPLDVSSKLIAIKDRRGIDRLCAAVCSLRDSMTRAVRDTIKDKEECALCTAVITGHRDLVSVETRIALARAGVSHILAVSGLHITAILGAVFWLLRKSGTPRSLSFVIATLMGLWCVLFYAGTPSVVRASVMALFAFGAQLSERRNDALTTLCAAALAVLLPNPLAVGEPSFVLSFTCCFAIVVVYPAADQKLRAALFNRGYPGRVALALLQPLTLSAVITAVSAPALIALGFPLSTFAPIANVVVIAIIPFLLASSFAVTIFSVLPYLEPLRMLSGLVAGLSAKTVIAVSRLISSWPYASLFTSAPYLKLWAIYVVVAFGLAFLFRGSLQRRRVRFVTATVSAFLVLLIGMLSRGALTLGTPRAISYGDCVIVDGMVNSIVVVERVSESSMNYLSCYLAERGVDDVCGVIVCDPEISEEKLAWAAKATGFDEVETLAELSYDTQDCSFEAWAGDMSVIVDENRVMVRCGGERVRFCADSEFPGFTITQMLPEGTRQLAGGKWGYHDNDMTIYFNGINGCKAVAE